MHKHKKLKKKNLLVLLAFFFISHHLLPRSSSISSFIHGSTAHALKVSSLKFDLTRGRLQQYKAKNRRNLCSSCPSSSRKTAKLACSPPQLGLIPTEASCREQIHKPRTKHTSGRPGLDQRLTYRGKSLSREQTSSAVSPQHFPIILTICSSGIP